MDDGMEKILSFDFDPAAEHLHIPNRSIGPPVTEFKINPFPGKDIFHLFFDVNGGEGVDLLNLHLLKPFIGPSVIIYGRFIGFEDISVIRINKQLDRGVILKHIPVPFLAFPQRLLGFDPLFGFRPQLFIGSLQLLGPLRHTLFQFIMSLSQCFLDQPAFGDLPSELER